MSKRPCRDLGERQRLRQKLSLSLDKVCTGSERDHDARTALVLALALAQRASLVLDDELEMARCLWPGRRSVGYGRERAAQTAGVLGLVLG
jgi:hypothetical protein